MFLDLVATGARVEHALMGAPARMPGRMRCRSMSSAAMCDTCRRRWLAPHPPTHQEHMHMAVTTGTTWDVVLSARPTQTEPGSAAISVRAAYQAALYERALLVDLGDQHATGEVHPDLAAAVLAPQELLGHLLNSTG